MIRVGIVGSREYPNEQQIMEMISLLPTDDVEIVSGGQHQGVDGWAKKYAAEHKLKYTEFVPAHYQGAPYDVANYHKRNRQIAEYCDIVYAFIHRPSRGTQSTINFCKETGTPVIIITPQTRSEEIEKSTGLKNPLDAKHPPIRTIKQVLPTANYIYYLFSPKNVEVKKHENK